MGYDSIVGFSFQDCPFCNQRREFMIVASSKVMPYKGKNVEYQGADAICPVCGNYHMFPELVDINLEAAREVIMHPEKYGENIDLPEEEQKVNLLDVLKKKMFTLFSKSEITQLPMEEEVKKDV